MAKRVVQTSGTVATPHAKAKMPPPSDAAELLERFKDYPAIDVMTRRFNNPSAPGSLPILLKDEDPNACVNTDHQNRLREGATKCHICKRPARKWFVYFFNFAKEGRASQMRQLGYVMVERKDLLDADDVADFYASKDDTYVRRGDRGQEVMGKQPLELYNHVKRLQYDQRMAGMMSGKRLRDDLAEAAGAELGDEAGQSLHDGAIKVESMKRHSTTMGEEAGGED